LGLKYKSNLGDQTKRNNKQMILLKDILNEIALQKFKNDIVAHNKGTVLKVFPRHKNREAWRYQLRYNIDLTDIKEFDKKYKKGIKSYHKFINEDWFDDYLVYEKRSLAVSIKI